MLSGPVFLAGPSYCALLQGHVEPDRGSRDEMRKWRTTVDMAEFKRIREKFDRAGVRT